MAQWVYFDVDDTLLLWESELLIRMCGGKSVFEAMPEIEVPNPYYSGNPYSSHGPILKLRKHMRHVDDLMKHHANGDIVVVWSAGGKEWAEAAVNALGINHMVSHILEKPAVYYDDLDVKEFMPFARRWRVPTVKGSSGI